MSNWLGFSLSPDLTIHDDDEDGNQDFPRNEEDEEETSATNNVGQQGEAVCFANPMPVMPLPSHGFFDQDWRYEKNMEGSPKLEDFLGSCYTTNSQQHSIPPPPPPPAGENLAAAAAAALPFHYPQPSSNPGAMYPFLFDNGASPATSSTSISGLKSWLRQTPFEPLSLAVTPSYSHPETVSPHPVIPPPPVPEAKKRPAAGPKPVAAREPAPRKSIDTFGQRTSQYRGVTRHRWTGRYEAHLWDNSCRKEGQTRKGRQGR